MTETLPPEAVALAARLFDSARSGQLDIFQQALPYGLPANMTNEKGDSLIMLAAYHGHAPVVELLLQHGADPNRLNDRGQSPLAGAVFKGEDHVIEVRLSSHRGVIERRSGSGIRDSSALEAAMLFKQEEKWRAKFETAPGRGKARKDEA